MLGIRSFVKASRWALAICCVALVWPGAARAHELSISVVDVRLHRGNLEVLFDAHISDVAGELSVEVPDDLLNPSSVATHAGVLVELVAERLVFELDGVRVAPTWLSPEILSTRQSIRLRATHRIDTPPTVMRISAGVFPNARGHQTYLSIYHDDQLLQQELLSGERRSAEYFAQTPRGRAALLIQFLRAGVHHIVTGPDHLLLLTGLLLGGGPVRRLLVSLAVFGLGHSLTISMGALSLVNINGALVEAAIAASVIWVGVENLLARGSPNRRVVGAAAFGLIHGLGLAGGLQDSGIPSGSRLAALTAFTVGVEVGQVLFVAVTAGLFAFVRARHETAARLVAVVGSTVVAVAGVFWLVERTL